MLGIFLLYFIWKYFADLATENKRPRRSNGWYGVICYYLGTFIGGVVVVILDELLNLGIDLENNLLISLLTIPFGLGACYLLYYLLQKNWSKALNTPIESIENIGKNDID